MDEESHWQDDALCAQVGPELFFPETGESAAPARSICRACPVAVECLEYAQVHAKKYGIYAGMGPKQRKRLRRKKAA
jgi:WhiB family redox-sensing transcriptional regulator